MSDGKWKDLNYTVWIINNVTVHYKFGYIFTSPIPYLEKHELLLRPDFYGVFKSPRSSYVVFLPDISSFSTTHCLRLLRGYPGHPFCIPWDRWRNGEGQCRSSPLEKRPGGADALVNLATLSWTADDRLGSFQCFPGLTSIFPSLHCSSPLWNRGRKACCVIFERTCSDCS